MRVVRMVRFGGPEVLVPAQAPEPVAGPGQVVVAVSVIPLDFVQTQLRRGVSPGPPLPTPPYVPGSAIAGHVSAVGAGVDPAWIDQPVLARTVDGTGGLAERALAAVEALIPVPVGLGLPQAAALQVDGGTALGLVESARVQAGQWVLVEAAGGGLGSLLVQLARAAGARVVGAAGSPAKRDRARELGAEAVVDYTASDWPDTVRRITDRRGADVVFDGVGGRIGRDGFAITAAGGRFVVHGAASGAATAIDPAEARRRGVTVIGLDRLRALADGTRGRVERVLAEAAAGRITPAIGRTFALERAQDAHAAMEARDVVGKTLLTI